MDLASAGAALPSSPLTVGDGSTTVHGNVGGIVDPPMIDAVNGFVYVVSGSSGGTSVLVQAGTTSFSSPSPVTATLGAGGILSFMPQHLMTRIFPAVTTVHTGPAHRHILIG